MNAPHRITLHRNQILWMATFSDPAVLDLHGTRTLPTAFRAIADGQAVRDCIAQLNPGAIVEVIK